jgi:hypothetical protein
MCRNYYYDYSVLTGPFKRSYTRIGLYTKVFSSPIILGPFRSDKRRIKV